MILIGNRGNINCLGEFADKNLEKEFFEHYMMDSIGYIKSILLVLCLLNTIFIIPDYFLVQNRYSFVLISIGRILFAALVLALFIFTKDIKNISALKNLITLYEISGEILFIFVLCEYENPDYLIQAYGVMILILSIFMVPNRWLNMIGVSLLIVVAFNVSYFYYIEKINTSELYAGVVYSMIVLMLSSVFAFRDSFYKRIHYFDTKELIRLSATDPLTGIYNRAKFNDELKQYVCCSRTHDTTLSLIIIDLDDFKKINDTYGHLSGDNIIVECTNIVRNNIRESDIFARWGGEEFVLLLPDMDIENSFEVGERIREKIENHIFSENIKMTCSFGIAELSIDDNTETILQKADKMLYAAKSSGKNTVMVYKP